MAEQWLLYDPILPSLERKVWKGDSLIAFLTYMPHSSFVYAISWINRQCKDTWLSSCIVGSDIPSCKENAAHQSVSLCFPAQSYASYKMSQSSASYPFLQCTQRATLLHLAEKGVSLLMPACLARSAFSPWAQESQYSRIPRSTGCNGSWGRQSSMACHHTLQQM